jgi:hypothetical protein
MSGLPSRRKIGSLRCCGFTQCNTLFSHPTPPPRSCPLQPLSAAAVCAIRHRRARNAAQELCHHPPSLGPVSVTYYCRQRHQPPPIDCRRHCFHCHMPRDAFCNPLTGAPCHAAKRWRAKNLQWMHLSVGEIMLRQNLHRCWAFTCVEWRESADGWEAAASQEVVMRQPARADEWRLRADNNCKQRELAADESGRQGKEGIAREWAAGGRDSAQEADTDERTT